MKVFGFLLFSCAIALTLGGVTNRLGGRIVSGQNVAHGEMPYMATILLYAYGHKPAGLTCGGIILNENYVLSVAGCVAPWENEDLGINAGSLEYQKYNAYRNVSKIYVHEGFHYDNNNSPINDIALVKVDRPFEFNEYLAPAKLVESDDVYDGKTVTIAGWGIAIPKERRASEVLQKVDVPVISNEQCNELFKDVSINIGENQMCTYDPKIERGPCNGDAGGPLIVNDVVVGLISWVYKGCFSNSDKPIINTKVYKYLDWIREHSK